jgi:hypothetical protein
VWIGPKYIRSMPRNISMKTLCTINIHYFKKKKYYWVNPEFLLKYKYLFKFHIFKICKFKIWTLQYENIKLDLQLKFSVNDSTCDKHKKLVNAIRYILKAGYI